jgi:hypothetical protein
VLVKTSGSEDIVALFSTDLKMEPETIIETFVLRWNIEVTFELAREHLGIETQRQWSDLAIQRTTPILFGLYSVITLIGIELHKNKKITDMSTAWYKKESVTFSDVLVSVRREIWRSGEFFFMKKFSEVKKIIAENQFSEIIEILSSTG